MTRSAAKRANRNARVIADGITYQMYEALDEAGAHRLAHQYAQRYETSTWNIDEVNWPLAAELMNRAANWHYGVA